MAVSKRSRGLRNSSREKWRAVMEGMTFSISATMTLRERNSWLLKTLRTMRSVRRCWTSILRMALSGRSGLMDWRQSSAKDVRDAGGKFGDFLCELGDGGLPIYLVGLAVLEEELEDFDEVFGGFSMGPASPISKGACGCPGRGRRGWGIGRGCW
jgi:hypothetical protein